MDLPIPPGYRVERRGPLVLIVRDSHAGAVHAAGLARPEGWSAATRRGESTTRELSDGTRVRLKQLRRGGLLAGLWRERFVGAARALLSLSVPVEMARRGLPTAEPLALLLAEGPRGWYRAWLATAELPQAQDLAARWRSATPPTQAELAQVARRVRELHDAGIDHPDLNLGNVLLSGADAYIIDLDAARMRPGPLSLRRRRQALWRLERSYQKRVGAAGSGPDWFGLYAAGDAELERRLRRGSSWARLRIALHRLGWRRA